MGPSDANLIAASMVESSCGWSTRSPGWSPPGTPKGSAVTAFMDEMAFLVAVRIGDVVHAHAQVNWAGTTSMEVGVKVMADRWNASVPATHVASAYLVMVAIGAGGRPRQVRPVLPGDEEDRRRYRQAQLRRDHRLQRRQAIRASQPAAP